jgi:hypothetical protein
MPDTSGIDLANENPISLKEAAQLPLFRRDGRAANFSTVWRWAKRGCRGIRLETIRAPYGTATTVEACYRFIKQLTALASNGEVVLRLPTPAHRSKQINEAKRILDAAGV